MTRRHRKAFTVATLLAVTAGTVVYLAAQEPRRAPLPSPSTRAAPPDLPDRASQQEGSRALGPLGRFNQPVTAQRPSFRDYLQRVAQEDFDALIKNLNQHEDVLIVPYGGGMQSEWAFHRCLDNRRLAKIYVELASRPRAEADRLTREIFAAKFQKYRTDFVASLDAGEDGTPPEGTGNVDDNLNAVYGAVFLSAIFCPVNEVLRQVKEWQEFGRSLDPRAEGIDDPKKTFLTRIMLDLYGRPESLFLLNIYAWMLRDRCADTDFEKLLPKGLPAQSVEFGAWNEKRDPVAARFLVGTVSGERPSLETLRPAGVAPDSTEGLHVRKLVFHPVWDCYPGHHTIVTRNREILTKLRKRLELCEPRETD